MGDTVHVRKGRRGDTEAIKGWHMRKMTTYLRGARETGDFAVHLLGFILIARLLASQLKGMCQLKVNIHRCLAK